jgi:hypothetical protein
MAQCLKGIIGIGLLVLLVWPSYSVEANTFTLEQLQEQLQGLRENYVRNSNFPYFLSLTKFHFFKLNFI